MKKSHSLQRNNIFQLLVFIAVPLAVGFLSARLSGNNMEEYQNLIQPSFAPPGWVFPVVWTMLYILMGIASYRIYSTGSYRPQVKSALFFYGLQLLANFLWSILFFGLQLRGIALLWLIFLWILILITTIKFYRLDKVAGFLMVPYLIWVSFAGILNYYVWQLNK